MDSISEDAKDWSQFMIKAESPTDVYVRSREIIELFCTDGQYFWSNKLSHAHEIARSVCEVTGEINTLSDYLPPSPTSSDS